MLIAQLVSDQTLPNILPLLYDNDLNVVLIRSSDRGQEAKADRIIQTLRDHFSWPVSRIHSAVIPSPNPSIEETISTFQAIHQKTPIDHINFTCGTKLMSIGAHAFARQHQIPSFYVDNSARKWIDGETSEKTLERPSFDQAVEKLTVPAILSAYGITKKGFLSEIPRDEWKIFGLKTARLRMLPEGKNALGHYLHACRTLLMKDHGKGRFLEGGKLRQALEKGLPSPGDDLIHQWLDWACSAGLIHRNFDRYYLHPAPGHPGLDSKEILRQASHAWRILEGGWWELAVLNAMEQSGRYQDIRWSVQNRTADSGKALGENDIVAIDRANFALTFVSCKTSDQFVKPLEHIFETKARATTYGGTFARVAFSLFETRKPSPEKIWEEPCRVVGGTFAVGFEGLAQWLKMDRTDLLG